MNVQSPIANKLNVVKPAALYLMELRRHFAELSSRRPKLTVGPWDCADTPLLPLLGRSQPLAKAES